MRTSTSISNNASPRSSMNSAQKEWLVQQIERGLATRSHARVLRGTIKDLSEPLFRAIASGTAGVREAKQVRQLLDLKGTQ